MESDRLLLFSGEAHRPLAAQIAQELGLDASTLFPPSSGSNR